MSNDAISRSGRCCLVACLCLFWYGAALKAVPVPGRDAPAAAAQAENGFRVSGRVSDEKGEPLVGVNIVVKGTNIGVASDVNGHYVIQIKSSLKRPVLEFSFLGMQTKEVAVSASTPQVNVVLKEDANALENAVVTGYAKIRKESFTGTSTTVSKEDILRVSPTNVLKALSVYDPSVRLVTNNEMGSDPNTLPEYYIRGRSGVSEITQLDQVTGNVDEFTLKNNPSLPVFMVDGFETDLTTIIDLDPNRIESVTILKDAAATAVYGSRAANGVIVIETTTPAPGAIRVNYSANASLTAPDLSSYDLMNAEEVLTAEWLAGLYQRAVGDGTSWAEYSAAGLTNYLDYMNRVTQGLNTDWISKPLRNAFNHKHSLSLEGGTNELRWGADVNYNDNGGVMKGSERKTYGASLKIDYNYKGLRVTNRFTFSHNDAYNSPYGSFGEYYTMKPYLDPIDPETDTWQKVFRITRFQRKSGTSIGTEIRNPLYEASLRSFSKTSYSSFTDNLGLNWHITPFLTARGSFSTTYKITDGDAFTDPMSGKFVSQKDPTLRGSYRDNEIRDISWNMTGQLSYFRTFEGHNINATFGAEAAESNRTSFTANYTGFLDGVSASPQNALKLVSNPSYSDSRTRRAGLFLQANYTYKDIYLFDISDRYEGSSAFGAHNRMGNFYSGGVGLNIHNYEAVRRWDVFDLFKVKVTYGQTGKANFSPYQARTTYNVLYDQAYVDLYGMTLKALGNEDLLWEKVNKFDAGTEISVLDNRLRITFDYYNETTIDQVQAISIPSSSGFKTYMGNMGRIRNQGVDLRLNIKLFQNKDWDVYAFVNGNHNRNRIVELGEALEAYNARIDALYASVVNPTVNNNQANAFATAFTKYEVGNSLSAIYGMKSHGIDPNTGLEIYENRDGSLTYAWNSLEQQRIGDADPLLNGSFGFNVRWKRWSMFTSFNYRFGGQAYNQTLRGIENVNLEYNSGDRRTLTDRWQKPGDVSTLKSIQDMTYITRPTSRFVQDENTLTFNSIQIQYSFNPALLRNWGLSGARISANTTDLLYLSSIKRERGTSYPYARTFNMSLYLTF
ncbi:MAG: SusC/RagA family TonB-linked outer membrane protein [Bacteroidales bacterium]|nr:SusC/RagA family TonB-linked outer membrane protein [Bacteroidales bacterium]